jgi:outer membrane lipoprotein-sorting protein
MHDGSSISTWQWALLAFSLLLSPASWAESVEDWSPPPGDRIEPAEILSAAFENRYDVDMVSTIKLVMSNSRGQERKREFEAVSKLIDGRLHSIGRLIWPHHLRGMTILTIEAGERGHDAFVYMPAMKMVRRISTAQRGDSFFGTDVTYEDLERRRVADYVLESARRSEIGGEAVYIITAKPHEKERYSQVTFSISQSDHAILEIRFFKRDQKEPYRVVSSDRASMVEQSGHVLPLRMTVRDLRQGSTTEVFFRDLEVDPEIDDRVFSVRTLEQQRDLPQPEG